jgi:DNA-binding protein Fis
MLEALSGSIPEYGSLNAKVSEDVYRAGVKHAELWYDTLLAGAIPCEEDLRWVGRFSQRRHDQDVSLIAVLQAYRLGARVYMNALLSHVSEHRALGGEVLFHVSPFLLYYNDLLGRTVSDAYFAHRNGTLLSSERQHMALCDAVLDPTRDAATAFEDAARALGVDASCPHVALALRVAEPHADKCAAPSWLAELMASADELAAAASAVTLHRGHVLLWIPAAAAKDGPLREESLIALALRLLRRQPHLDCAGIGTAAYGAAGWRSSAEQACAAIEMGRRLRPNSKTLRYSEFAFDTLLRQSGEMSSLCTEAIARLANEQTLLETLEAYFEHRQNHKAVAAALGIHRNTLVHRLGRIEALMGERFDDMGWVSRLYLGVRQRQLAGGRAPRQH